MALFDNDLVNDLKSKVNIVDVISQYVALSKNGNRYLGLCPFHGEKTPSFNVNTAKGFYHCFGCGKSGDVIEFLKEYKQIGFKDAVVELADYAGVPLAVERDNEKQENPNHALYEINNQAARLYNILLMSTEIGEQAREYLEARGITAEVIKRFNIGLSPDENDFIYKNLSQKFEEDVLANSGLFHFSNQKVFDAFTNRIMFPITNEYGQTIGFSGRKWQEGDTSKAKYINTTQTPIFDKSFELWNFDKAKPSIAKSHEVYLMEGFMDVIAAYKAGVMNVVASMGTALTEKHVHRLRQTVKDFVLVYDGDAAGQNAIYKAMNLIGERSVSIVRIPERLDPDEYAKTYGLDELSRLMKQGRIQPIEFLIDFLRPENLSNLQVQIDFIDQIAPMISKVPSITAQDAFIRKLVEILPDFEYNQVENAVNLHRENMQAGTQGNAENFQGFQEVPTNFPEPDFTSLTAPEETYFAPGYGDGTRVTDAKSQTSTTGGELLRAKLSKTELVEEQLLNRMVYHPTVLRKFAQDENFHFVHQSYQELFDKLLLEAMTYDRVEPNHFAEALEASLKGLFYEIISLDLPEEVSGREIEDLIENLQKDQVVSQLEDSFKQLEAARKSGNKERELELTIQIINQKKKL